MEVGIADWPIWGLKNKTDLLIMPVVGERRWPDEVNCRRRLRALRLTAGGRARPPATSLAAGCWDAW
jgi:hypothetical protein